MLEFDTPFRRLARHLKPPTGRDFKAADWLAAWKAETNPTDSDRALMVAAIWMAAQSAMRRSASVDPEFDALGPAAAVILAVATLNREFLVTSDLSDEMMEQAYEEGAVSFGHVVNRPLKAGTTRQSVTGDEAVEGTGDVVELWLFDGYAKTGNGAGPEDLAPVAFRAIKRYSIQHGLNDIWNQGLWEDWRLMVDDRATTWGPSDVALATKLEAGLVRQRENFMNFPHIDMRVWAAMTPEGRRQRTLPRTVLDVSSTGRRKIRVGRPLCLSRRPPMFLIERAGLEGSYLSFLLDDPFPKYPDFSVRFILQAWAVLLDLARLLAKRLRRSETLSLSEARTAALIVSKWELLDVLMRALAIDEVTATAVIDFLAYAPRKSGEKGHRGIWAAPLVPIPGEERFALALSALAVSNTLRKAEAWMEKGGLDDNLSKNARGDIYEADYRAKVMSAIEKNPLLTKAACAKDAIKKDTNFGEEIDMLIRLDDLLIVGEVKCWLYPADSHERFNHFRKIKKAAEQATRKAGALRSRPDVAAKALGLTELEIRCLRVLPLVVANQGFGFSLDADGCRVTDAAYLLTYLTGGRIVSDTMSNAPLGSATDAFLTFYEREKQAGDRFETMFETPPVLQRFADRIDWTTIPFPLPSGDALQFSVPRLGDLSAQ